MQLLLDLQYLPNTTYFSLLATAEKVIIEKHENFVKQTYRNRAHILTPNGVDVLSIPLIGSQKKIKISEIKIDHSQKWANRHWRAIKSAYGKAPFFEHYADYIKQEIYAEHTTLFNLNLQLLTLCLKFLQIDTPLEFTSSYQKTPKIPLKDLRSSIHPKNPFSSSIKIEYIAYPQVFGNSFVQNLSILDLLFSEGPNAGSIIRKQIN
ncbi:MAG: WbqC family protein [Cyclobacteriaceae bacterium]|nr:WbqC family protein [Cyclobacteriaceae bacterium]